MKKLKLLILTAICVTVIIPCKVHAVDVTVGATTWFAWWDIDQGKDATNINPAFLLGPVLAVKINDEFNLTFVFLYGKYDYDGSEHDSGVYKDKIKTKRSDSDFALNYRLHDFLKVFAGIKYMAYKKDKNEGAYPTAAQPNPKQDSVSSDHYGYGPGIGVSSTYPVFMDNMFLLATLSGFYTWGNEKVSPSFEQSHSIKLNEYGFNTNLSIAYYIAEISTVVSLGGRFQYFITSYDRYINVRHMFYGVTLTATYTFSL